MNKKRIVVSLLIAAVFISINAREVPTSLVGNWIETQSNDWKYGFFENFAVYECGFWNYASIETKGANTKIVLQKDGKTVDLKIDYKNDSVLMIKNGKSKAQHFTLMRKRYPDYKTPDNTPFPVPQFKRDSATVIGYYRNFDQYADLLAGMPDKMKDGYLKPVFSLHVNDFLTDEAVDFQTNIDSLGRFSLTFPILNSQETYADWGRLTRQLLFSPGDTLFVFADLADLVQPPNTDYWNDFWLRDKQILFMGNNARLNNELMQYKSTFSDFHPHEMSEKGIVNMEYLQAGVENWENRSNNLEDFIASHPNFSEKFKFYKRNWETFQLAFNLMQHRFYLPKSQNGRLPAEYIDYVTKNIPKYNPQVYTLVREYRSFIRDYVSHYSEYTKTIVGGSRRVLAESGLDTPGNIQVLEAYENFVRKIVVETDTTRRSQLVAEHKEVLEKGNELYSNPLIRKAQEAYFRSALLDMDYHTADSLLQEPILKELWTTGLYLQDFEQKRMPWPDIDLQTMKSRISNPFLQEEVLKMNDYYAALAKEDFVYPASFVGMDDWGEEEDADAIFQKITAPYKGKVILMDFWGTWCGPCRRDIESSGGIKKAMQGKDVVFVYLANNSPEQAWKNYIKKVQLTGEQIVHYRLPDRQQSLLEQKLKVRGFPSYFVIDRKGNIFEENTDFFPLDLNEAKVINTLNKVMDL